MATPIRRVSKLFCGALLALLAGCPFFDDSDDAVADPQTTQVVGAAGGQVVSPDGSFKLDVPAGALAAETAITVVEVSAGNVPANLQPIGADRVYRLEPAGLTFAQPATVTVTIQASSQLAVMVLESEGVGSVVSNARLVMSGAGRQLSGGISHFSNVIVKSIGESVSVEMSIAKRQFRPGELAEGSIVFDKAASDVEFEVEEAAVVLNRYDSFDVPKQPTGLTGPLGREGRRVEGSFSVQCVKPDPIPAELSLHMEVRDMTAVALVYLFQGQIRFDSTVSFDKLSIDITCEEDSASGGVRTGAFVVPFGGRPDGLRWITGPWAGLPDNGAGYVAIALDNGVVIMDLRTGLSALNMTASGPDGRLGSGALLGTLPVSLAGPGPATVAGLFATGAQGAVRSYTPDGHGGFVWGATAVTLRPVLDAAAAGGGYVSDAVFTVEPFAGINTWSVRSDFWQYDATIPASAYSGSLVSAAVPFADGGRVLALTDDGATSKVWDLFRFQPGAVPTEIADLGGTGARQLRCLPESATPASLAGFGLCGATLTRGEMRVFIIRPDFPPVAPAVTVLPVGKGALGLDLGLRVSGEPVAVVANFEDQTLNLIDFDTEGNVTANRTLPVPKGCLSPPHAVHVAAGGKDYLAGSCSGSGQYFVIEAPPR